MERRKKPVKQKILNSAIMILSPDECNRLELTDIINKCKPSSLEEFTLDNIQPSTSSCHKVKLSKVHKKTKPIDIEDTANETNDELVIDLQNNTQDENTTSTIEKINVINSTQVNLSITEIQNLLNQNAKTETADGENILPLEQTPSLGKEAVSSSEVLPTQEKESVSNLSSADLLTRGLHKSLLNKSKTFRCYGKTKIIERKQEENPDSQLTGANIVDLTDEHNHKININNKNNLNKEVLNKSGKSEVKKGAKHNKSTRKSDTICSNKKQQQINTNCDNFSSSDDETLSNIMNKTNDTKRKLQEITSGIEGSTASEKRRKIKEKNEDIVESDVSRKNWKIIQSKESTTAEDDEPEQSEVVAMIEQTESEGKSENANQETSLIIDIMDSSMVVEKAPRDIDEEKVSNDAVAVKTVKKRRGRPPKNKDASLILKEEVKTEALGELRTSSYGRRHRKVDYKVLVEPLLVDILEPKVEYVEDDNESFSVPVKAPAKRRGRQPKKANILEHTLELNENGTVLCVICDNEVQNDDWMNHRENIHYGLAWRAGEIPLDMGDDNFTNKTLQKHLNARGSLTCCKCGESKSVVAEFRSHIDVCLNIQSNSGNVTCAVCNENMPRAKWASHKYRSHNNLTWRIGDAPLDLDDRALVVNILNNITLKQKKPLHCEKCGIQKKSSLGYLSHASMCRKSVAEIEKLKVTCTLCGNRMLPVSYDAHLKITHAEKKPNSSESLSHSDIAQEPIDGKRKAAKKALGILQEFSKDGTEVPDDKLYVNRLEFVSKPELISILKTQISDNGVSCKFDNCAMKCENIEALLEHMESCPATPSEFYTCLKCLSISESEEEVKAHLITTHRVRRSAFDDEFNLFENEEDIARQENENLVNYKMRIEKTKRESSSTYKVTPRFLLNLPRFTNCIYIPAYAWTEDFCNEHYVNDSTIFEDIRKHRKPNLLIHDELWDDFLPAIQVSCDVAELTGVKSDKNGYEFKQYEIFEASVNSEGTISTLFCGGPVSSIAWMPTPHTSSDCDQILAVSVLKSPSSAYNLNTIYRESSTIQFWSFGKLKTRQIEMDTPEFLYGFGHNYGPIWHMEWCPSSCYSQKIMSYGLLAVAGSTPSVAIFEVNKMEPDCLGLFYKVYPLIELELEEKNDNVHPTRISWSKAKGHRTIAVGYSNGLVALFDLGVASNILWRETENGQHKLFPYKIFQAHVSAITALALSHLCGGDKWLMTGSLDRESHIWDVESYWVKISSYKAGPVTDGSWMTHWLGTLTAEDDSRTAAGSAKLIIKPPRDFFFESAYLLGAKSTINSMTTSDWLNGIIQGTIAGELMVVFPNQLSKVTNDKRLYRLSLGKAKLVEKPSNIEEDSGEPLLNYEETTDKCGVLFMDPDLSEFEYYKKPKRSVWDEAEQFTYDRYNLHSVNKVAFNPNKQSCTYFAAGYQSGFVRVYHLRSLEIHNEHIQ